MIALVAIQLQACTPVQSASRLLMLTTPCSTRREALSCNRKFYSLEFFPPHTVEGARNLVNRMDRLVKLEPKPLSIDQN